MSLPPPSASVAAPQQTRNALLELHSQHGGLSFLWVLLYLDLQAIGLVAALATVARWFAPDDVPALPDGFVQLLVAWVTYEAARWLIKAFDNWAAARATRVH